MIRSGGMSFVPLPAISSTWMSQLPRACQGANAVSITRYEPSSERVQNVVITAGGKSEAQDFGIMERRWRFALPVPDVGVGSMGDTDDG